jgi:hypothetical protein
MILTPHEVQSAEGHAELFLCRLAKKQARINHVLCASYSVGGNPSATARHSGGRSPLLTIMLSAASRAPLPARAREWAGVVATVVLAWFLLMSTGLALSCENREKNIKNEEKNGKKTKKNAENKETYRLYTIANMQKSSVVKGVTSCKPTWEVTRERRVAATREVRIFWRVVQEVINSVGPVQSCGRHRRQTKVPTPRTVPVPCLCDEVEGAVHRGRVDTV